MPFSDHEEIVAMHHARLNSIEHSNMKFFMSQDIAHKQDNY